jgi:hypothetical protein
MAAFAKRGIGSESEKVLWQTRMKLCILVQLTATVCTFYWSWWSASFCAFTAIIGYIGASWEDFRLIFTYCLLQLCWVVFVPLDFYTYTDFSAKCREYGSTCETLCVWCRYVDFMWFVNVGVGAISFVSFICSIQ